MSDALSDAIHNIVLRCTTRDISFVDERLVGLLIRHLLFVAPLLPELNFIADGEQMLQEDVQRLSAFTIETLASGSPLSPALRVLVSIDQSLLLIEQEVKEYLKVRTQRTQTAFSRIQAKTNQSANDQIYTEFVTLTANLAVPEPASAKSAQPAATLPREEQEAIVSALASVVPRKEAFNFRNIVCSQGPDQLTQLAEIAIGVRLFDGFQDTHTDIHERLQRTEQLLKTIEALLSGVRDSLLHVYQPLIYIYAAALRAKRTDLAVVSPPHDESLLRDAVPQAGSFARIITEAVSRWAHLVSLVHMRAAAQHLLDESTEHVEVVEKELSAVQYIVSSRSSVPKSSVYPHFRTAAQNWTALFGTCAIHFQYITQQVSILQQIVNEANLWAQSTDLPLSKWVREQFYSVLREQGQAPQHEAADGPLSACMERPGRSLPEFGGLDVLAISQSGTLLSGAVRTHRMQVLSLWGIDAAFMVTDPALSSPATPMQLITLRAGEETPCSLLYSSFTDPSPWLNDPRSALSTAILSVLDPLTAIGRSVDCDLRSVLTPQESVLLSLLMLLVTDLPHCVIQLVLPLTDAMSGGDSDIQSRTFTGYRPNDVSQVFNKGFVRQFCDTYVDSHTLELHDLLVSFMHQPLAPEVDDTTQKQEEPVTRESMTNAAIETPAHFGEDEVVRHVTSTVISSSGEAVLPDSVLTTAKYGTGPARDTGTIGSEWQLRQRAIILANLMGHRTHSAQVGPPLNARTAATQYSRHEHGIQPRSSFSSSTPHSFRAISIGTLQGVESDKTHFIQTRIQ